MLRATFCHFKGLGARAEVRLWESGILTWELFRRAPWLRFISKSLWISVCKQMEESETMLCKGNLNYFLARLPGWHKIRVLSEFPDAAAFVDVETTGLDPDARLTTVALYRGGVLQFYVQGQSPAELASALDSSLLVVTYNGARFDLPVLRSELGVSLRCAHLDLCPLLRALGFRGGLKACERLAGISRKVGGAIDGDRAVKLWKLYSDTRDGRALKLLLAYNAQDAVSLQLLACKVYARSMERYPMKQRLFVRHQPHVDFDPSWERLFFDN